MYGVFMQLPKLLEMHEESSSNILWRTVPGSMVVHRQDYFNLDRLKKICLLIIVLERYIIALKYRSL